MTATVVTFMEKRAVARGLREAERVTTTAGRWCQPWLIARESRIGGRTLGERRVRKVLAQLLEERYVQRHRSHSLGHIFMLTQRGHSFL